ncbi:DUF7221 family queuine tRNA-ribosyltransferase-like protein [Nocardia nepalensis]|uniref:deazapurine DNA modification protein DpdA family protein n=1 Tax=Nocardia nepalensis TaxID=3375448 RepID=UPI003B678D14
MRFFLGTHHPVWLKRTDKDLFVSDRQLRDRRSFPRALGEWALDSGGFTELQKFGGWVTTTPAEYVARARRYSEEIGGLVWIAPQDYMCEPFIIHGGQVGEVKFAGTGLSKREHLHRTVGNLLDLRSLAPEAAA